MRYRLFAPLLAFSIVWLGTAPLVAMAQQGGASNKTESLEEKNRRYFPDLAVMTNEGREVRFYSELLKDKIVVISFFYTNCATTQASMETLSKLQEMLGGQLGTDIHLLSISVDPERDSLKAIQEFAAKYNPKKGRMFLTGKKENLDAINLKLGNRSLIPEAHQQVFLLGNLKTGHWMRLPESANADAVAVGLHTLASDR